jgi:membrane protein implicated in regulation of membrane protease activity
MQPALAWVLAGLLLVVVELMTGTFYLLSSALPP